MGHHQQRKLCHVLCNVNSLQRFIEIDKIEGCGIKLLVGAGAEGIGDLGCVSGAWNW